MPECVMLIALAKIPPGKRCDFSWPLIRLSAPPPPTLTRQRLKHRQRININKTMLFASPSLAFHTKFTNRIKKQINIPS